jgi:hypothetical protein
MKMGILAFVPSDVSSGSKSINNLGDVDSKIHLHCSEKHLHKTGRKSGSSIARVVGRCASVDISHRGVDNTSAFNQMVSFARYRMEDRNVTTTAWELPEKSKERQIDLR